jgi:hypothetical protein
MSHPPATGDIAASAQPEPWSSPPPEAFYAAFQRHREEARALWGQFSAEWLTEESRFLDGDLQMVLILAVLALKPASPAVGGGVAGASFPSRTTSAVARLTGIPRETVRRKLDHMAERGWIERLRYGGWRIRVGAGSAALEPQLTSLEEATIMKLCKFMAAFHLLLDR